MGRRGWDGPFPRAPDVGETISIRLMHSLPDDGPLSGETTEKPETAQKIFLAASQPERLVRADPR
jgi:hypothetical protein